VGNIMLYHKQHHLWATDWVGPVQINLKTQVLPISHELPQMDMQPHQGANQKMTFMQDLLRRVRGYTCSWVGPSQSVMKHWWIEESLTSAGHWTTVAQLSSQ
jgi:hypothetical protein